MPERSTERALPDVHRAVKEATALNHDHTGSEHMLLWLLHGTDRYTGVRSAIEERYAGRDGDVVLDDMSLTCVLRALIEDAERAAGREQPDADHFRKAILRLDRGAAAEVLQDLPDVAGVLRKQLRSRAGVLNRIDWRLGKVQRVLVGVAISVAVFATNADRAVRIIDGAAALVEAPAKALSRAA